MQSVESNGSNASSYLMYVLCFGLFLMILGQGSVIYMILLIRALTFMLHLPSFQIIFPANVLMIISLLINIVTFDIVGFFLNWAGYPIWGFNLNINPTNSFQMQTIGYNNRNLFSSLGTLSFLILIYFFRVFIACLFKIYLVLRKINKGFSFKLYSFISNGLFFK